MDFLLKIKNKKRKEIEIYKAIMILCFERLFDMVFCARFIFFAFVTIAIGTSGIWVPVLFQIDLSSSVLKCDLLTDSLINNDFSMRMDSICIIPRKIGFENFPMFMYVVGVLGMLAADFFIKRPRKETEDPVKLALLSFCMFIWFLALILSFWGLKVPMGESWQLKVSVWLTVSLWLSSLYTDGEFDTQDVAHKLAGTLPASRSNDKSDSFNGVGLDD
ncbi:hypothetical protein [Shewanella algae]|uniref:hypothetical protein n=1 Tax=Shewanella algae TaxID=38313 RepID=UPI0030074AB4